MRALSVALAAAAIVFLVDGHHPESAKTTKLELKKLLNLLKEVEKDESKTDMAKDASSYSDACTYAHNNVRRRHGVPDLTWSSSLASASQIWADTLADGAASGHDPNNNYGENLWAKSVSFSGNEFECSDAVFSWYDEVNNPGYDFNNPGYTSGIGHFTQVVWETSVQVGCATATRESGGSSTSTIVCRYDPPGNYNSQYQFAENVPQLTSGNSYPTSHRDLEENPCHDKASSCSDWLRYDFCSRYDFFADVCWSSCGNC